MTADRDLQRAELDEAMNALVDVTVALGSLYPVLMVVSVPQEARGFVEDGMEAASRARRQLIALRLLLDDGPALHSVRVEP